MDEGWKDYELREFGERAERYGICDRDVFYRRLRMCRTKGESISIYKRCIDWCLETQYPGIEFLRREYKTPEIENLGVFIDRRFNGELLDGEQAYVFHHCTGRIRVAMNYDRVIIPMLYFANGCDMEVVCGQENYGHPIRVPLYIFGDNDIAARDDGHASYVWYKKALEDNPPALGDKTINVLENGNA